MPIVPTPVVFGVNWYQGFDPRNLVSRRDGIWIPPRRSWGSIRGGHAIVGKSPHLKDSKAWYEFYDQGSEGACVGYSLCRKMTHLNRKRYSGLSLYHEAQKIDEWAGENYDGTSVRAGCDYLRHYGLFRVRSGRETGPHLSDGILVNRWATSIAEIAACLSPQDSGRRVLDQGYVTWANSWGWDYPYEVKIALEDLEVLIFHQDGECTMVTDR
jgi:hypothetical protein